VAEMNEKGSCYREIPSWLTRRSGTAAAEKAEKQDVAA
jgi:hypothetical protein